MPSAVSRSREGMSGAPRLSWGRLIFVAIALHCCAVGAVEAYCRSVGFRPNVPDTPELWYFWRQQVYARDGRVIVLAGTSRIASDISLATLRECLPNYRVVQLGIPGAVSCIGLLKDLADDQAFRGIVICELDTALLQRSEWDGQRDFRKYKPQTTSSLIDVSTKALLQDRLVLISNGMTLRQFWEALFNANWSFLSPKKTRRTFGREVQWDFSVGRNESLRKQNMNRARTEHPSPPPRETIIDDARAIEPIVQSLRSRGGDVVFLRAPSSGQLWAHEKDVCPKRDWDRFAQFSHALCIHFQDVPEMRTLLCPDDSHLDHRDSPVFTRALATRLAFSPALGRHPVHHKLPIAYARRLAILLASAEATVTLRGTAFPGQAIHRLFRTTPRPRWIDCGEPNRRILVDRLDRSYLCPAGGRRIHRRWI
jgi:hypothetical protein